MVTIEILYAEGCLNVDKARTEVQEAIRRGHLEDVEVVETLVRNEAHAQEVLLPGTPTIRLDGRDIAEDQIGEVGTHMRIYEFNGILMGHPGWQNIIDAVKQAQESS